MNSQSAETAATERRQRQNGKSTEERIRNGYVRMETRHQSSSRWSIWFMDVEERNVIRKVEVETKWAVILKPDIYLYIPVYRIGNFLFRYQKKCDEMEVRSTQMRMTYNQMIADRDEIIHYLEGLKRQKSTSTLLSILGVVLRTYTSIFFAISISYFPF